MPSGRSHYRRIASATGACIVFIFNPGCAQAANQDENFVTGQAIGWSTANLPTGSGVSHTDYYALATNGNASSTTTLSTAGTSYTTAASPTTHSLTPTTNGIYVFASLNNATNSWDAIAYILVGALPNIETYTDGTLSTKSQTFTTNSSGSGVTVYIAATVLDTTDSYMVGIEDQLTGQCVFTAPLSSQTTFTGAPYHLCNLTSTAATGALPNNNGLVLANWAVTLGTGTVPPEGGTYMATIFDQTTGQRVASRQFSIIDGRASAGTGRIWLQAQIKYTSGVTYPTALCSAVAANELGSGTTASSTRIAWNGTATNVDDTNYGSIALCVGASQLAVNTDAYEIVVTDPTGTIATEAATTAQTSANVLCTGAGECIPPSSEMFTVPAQSSIPFELAYPGSTWTATLYDTTLGKVVAAQAFQFLGYTATWGFTTPTASTTLNIATGTSQATSLLITNTSDLTFGSNNGDSEYQFYAVESSTEITDVTMEGPGQSTPCDPKTATNNECTATYSDSAGNPWTVNLIFLTGTYVAFQVLSQTAPLAPGSTINITGLTFTASGCYNNFCYFQTTEVPTHGLNLGQPSAGGQVSNYFYVTNGVGTTGGTATVGLAGYYSSTAPTTFVPIKDAYTPRCATNESNCTTAGLSQAILANNQPFTGAASKVVLAYKLTNTSATGTSIKTFELAPPAAFNLASATIDASSPNGATLTDTGTCGIAQSATLCITPTTPIPSGSTQTFYIDFTPPSVSFSYSDLVGTIVLTQTAGITSAQLTIPITPTTSSVATFIGSPTSVDSTAIGAYSLNGGLMTAGVTPSTVGTSTTNTLNFNLRNTTSGADPFPDEVDLVAVQFPSTSAITVPTSCTSITTATAGWSCQYVNVSAGVTTFYFGQCPQQVNPVPIVPGSSTSLGSDALTVCPFSLPNEPYSLGAGSTFTASIPVTAGSSAASNITISSFGHGATTDAWSTPITTAFSVVTTAAAGAGFSSVTGPGGTLAGLTQGNEPSVTGDYQGTSPNYYETYVYKFVNTGSVPITSATIAIPSEDTTGTNGADSSGTIWNVTATPTLVIERTGNSNGCSITSYTNPTSGTSAPGSINISCPGTDFNVGDTLDVTFTAKTPLKINSTYAFTPTVNGSAAGVSANWTDDEDILIALSATVSINVNPSMACGGTATPGSGLPSATVATQTVNFGQIAANKYEYCKDAMIVQVVTDAANPTNWSLYASASGNPPTTGGTASAAGSATTESASNELLVSMDAASSTGGSATVPTANIPCPSGSGYTSCFSYDNTAAYAAMSLTSSGTGNRLGYSTNGGTGVNNGTVTFYVNYQVAIGTEAVPSTGYQETITYTWLAN